ncbi:MAG: EAL domain-containing protein [Microthrixaceae bacterium]
MTAIDASVDLTADLLLAVERDEVRVHYLPIVGLTNGLVVGVEALARWHRADRVLDTQVFLGLAERTGSIVDIGHRVMERAFADVMRWNTRNPARSPLRLSVNLSLRQLEHPDFVNRLHGLLDATGFDASSLWLEVGEDSLHALGHAVGPILLSLQERGIRLSVDDFGTGASSLVALQRYHLDELKIDRSFVAQMDADGDAATIVRGVVRLAQSLGLDTVAEGVERPVQEQMLRSLGCELAQGWLYARPGEDLDATIATADRAANDSLDRRPAENQELWEGSPSALSATRFVEAVFESAPIGMVLIDEAGRHLAANPAVARLLGREVDELLDMTCWEAVHPEDLREDLAGMDALLRGECPTYVVEERVVGRDGLPRWVEVTVTGVPGDHQANGTHARLLRQVRSIEETRRASEDAAVLRSVVAASPDALVITDELGRCTLWNPAAERLFGWTEKEMLGSTLTRLVDARSQLFLARTVGDATAGAAVRWPDATWLSSTGEERAVDVTFGPIVDASGTRMGLVVLARDVSEQRAAAAELALAHEALGLHAADVAAANVRLETFASTLSHDLMQPVVALDGFLSLLREEATELDDEHREWLAGALRGKDRVSAAIDALYRNAVDEELSLVPVDMARLVSDLVPGLIAEIGGAEVIVGDLPTVAADWGLVTQILANLIQNAGRYRHEERPLVVDLQARTDGADAWVIVVADTGKGISTDELEAVFQPGRRGRSADGVGGTGTGLATVRTLMQRMGGEAWAEPEPSGGVRMCLRFQGALVTAPTAH